MLESGPSGSVRGVPSNGHPYRDLEQQTGLSQEELLARLSRELPTAVDKYTPEGRLPDAAA